MHDGEFRSLKKEDDLMTISLNRALELLAIPKPERPARFGGPKAAAKPAAKKTAAKRPTRKSAAKKSSAKKPAAKKTARKSPAQSTPSA